MSNPSELRYTQEHEWMNPSGDRWRIGITEFAAKQMGDVVFVELPEVGRVLDRHDEFGTVESVKAVSELFSPVSGKITAINEALRDDPELLNTDPYGDGWIIEIEPSQKAESKELMSSEQYDKFITEDQS